MGLIVHELRQLMFNQWMVAPTSKNSKVQYCPVTMTDRYKDWAPPWWSSWKALGPPAGSDCCAVFMSECCGFTAVPNEGDIVPFQAFERHFLEVSNAKGLSREKAAIIRKEDLKKEKDASDLSSLPTVHRSAPSQSQLIINLEMRKERRLLRAQEIERLSWLIQRAEQRKDEGKKDQWQLELDLLYEAPLDQNESEYDASLSSIPSLIETTTPRSTSVLPACSISVDVRQVFSPISKLCDLNKHQEDVRRIEQSNLIFSEQVASSLDTFVEDSPLDQVDKVDANDSLVIEHPHSPIDKEFAPSLVAVVAAKLELHDDASVKALQAVQRKKMFEEAQQFKHQTLFVRRVLCGFKRIVIPKDGHCLFHCFAFFFNKHDVQFISSKYFPTDLMGVKFSANIIRNVCADELIRLDGKIPGLLFVCII